MLARTKCILLLGACLGSLLGTTTVASGQISWNPPTTPAKPNETENVIYDSNKFQYHKQDCIWSQRCTRNCEKIKRGEAIRKGGKPCLVCGG